MKTQTDGVTIVLLDAHNGRHHELNSFELGEAIGYFCSGKYIRNFFSMLYVPHFWKRDNCKMETCMSYKYSMKTLSTNTIWQRKPQNALKQNHVDSIKDIPNKFQNVCKCNTINLKSLIVLNSLISSPTNYTPNINISNVSFYSAVKVEDLDIYIYIYIFIR